jgi:hypothetical protein
MDANISNDRFHFPPMIWVKYTCDLLNKGKGNSCVYFSDLNGINKFDKNFTVSSLSLDQIGVDPEFMFHSSQSLTYRHRTCNQVSLIVF